jgi:hypothetical protein
MPGWVFSVFHPWLLFPFGGGYAAPCDRWFSPFGSGDAGL